MMGLLWPKKIEIHTEKIVIFQKNCLFLRPSFLKTGLLSIVNNILFFYKWVL